MRNIADVPGGKPIAVLLQFSGVSAINPLVAFYDILAGKREMLFFYFVPDTTRGSRHETSLMSKHYKMSVLYKCIGSGWSAGLAWLLG
jgi:hypothetical protein